MTFARILKHLVLVLLIGFTISACGVKGPLMPPPNSSLHLLP